MAKQSQDNSKMKVVSDGSIVRRMNYLHGIK